MNGRHKSALAIAVDTLVRLVYLAAVVGFVSILCRYCLAMRDQFGTNDGQFMFYMAAAAVVSVLLIVVAAEMVRDDNGGKR